MFIRSKGLFPLENKKQQKPTRSMSFWIYNHLYDEARSRKKTIELIRLSAMKAEAVASKMNDDKKTLLADLESAKIEVNDTFQKKK